MTSFCVAASKCASLLSRLCRQRPDSVHVAYKTFSDTRIEYMGGDARRGRGKRGWRPGQGQEAPGQMTCPRVQCPELRKRSSSWATHSHNYVSGGPRPPAPGVLAPLLDVLLARVPRQPLARLCPPDRTVAQVDDHRDHLVDVANELLRRVALPKRHRAMLHRGKV